VRGNQGDDTMKGMGTIRHAIPADIPAMQLVFSEAKEKMRAAGNMEQWTGGYPSDGLLLSDMERGFSYVMEDDGQIMATFVLAECEDPTYRVIHDGAWLEDTLPYGTIHRIASRHGYHGILESVVEWSWRRIPNLRIDTHRDNLPMRHLMEKLGFSYCGIIFLANGDERLAYQKIMIYPKLLTMNNITKNLQTFIERKIIPLYSSFDKAHQQDHAASVIEQSLALVPYYDVDIDMVYAIAAYHDLGLQEDRKTHHLVSGRIVRADKRLNEWFSGEQIETMAQAVEDHRASSDHEPRSIYGKIVAEADRLIDGETILRRTVQY